MKLVITLFGLGRSQKINVCLKEETPGALDGLAAVIDTTEVNFSEPIVAMGARFEVVNEVSSCQE